MVCSEFDKVVIGFFLLHFHCLSQFGKLSLMSRGQCVL
jgi:hypothetical protein